MIRYGLVFLTWSGVTLNYYFFSYSIHHNRHRFEPPHGGDTRAEFDHQDHEHEEDCNDCHFDPHGGGHEEGHNEHPRHGRGAFELDLSRPGFFLYGLALPLLLLTLMSLFWNSATEQIKTNREGSNLSHSSSAITNSTKSSKGDVNVKKWTLIWFLLPLLYIMLEGSLASYMPHSQGHPTNMNWNIYVRICMSFMSTSGYAATWALSLFLIPVTKHSPILDWLRVTPVQALAFHRIAGWTSLWNSIFHGFLHLRHLMDVLNPGRLRSWHEQLKILLIPSSWECLGTQHLLQVFWGRQDPMKGSSEAEANQCWLALVNATGMISVLAFVLLAITSIPKVRRYWYSLFYYVHIPMAWIMLVMAIWHYPTCALILIPNIIYYLSFNVPVFITQTMEHMVNWKKNSSPLLEANLIEGGSIELTFMATPKDHLRHESRFAKIYCPSVSPLSHPFSIFSYEDLDNLSSSMSTFSILLRPTGPFTEKLTEALFSNISKEETITSSSLTEPLVGPQSPRLSSPVITLDSFYAATHDWINHDMVSHDEIMLVAGGVGIVPFLEFLPSLQRRIVADVPDASEESNLDYVACFGPKQVHLHWYCREVGLASYIWFNALRNHAKGWESNPICQGRLKIHFHLTSLQSTTSKGDVEHAEEILSAVPNSGLKKKLTFTTDIIHPVLDAPFTQSRWLGLLLPGSIMTAGTILHWWWYVHYVIDIKFRHDNLVIRSYSIIFTLFLAMMLSFLVQYTYNKMRKSTNAYTPIATELKLGDTESDLSVDDILLVSKGRPAADDVIGDILRADQPGVYSCGPLALMQSVEKSIKSKRADCAFYCEDSEM